MPLSTKEFIKEIQAMVRKKHSKDHPVIGMIERGELDRDQLKGFVGQFYLFFPKPFPKPIAGMLARCPDDPELEKMWIENVVTASGGPSWIAIPFTLSGETANRRYFYGDG